MPAAMFALQGILAEFHAQGKPEEPAQDSEKAIKDKAKKDGNNGAIVGNTIGGALVAGLMNAPKDPVQALCSALIIGAGSALGAKTSQWTGEAMNDPGEPGDNDNEFGKGMVSPFAGNFVGTGVCIGLGEAICGNLDKIAGIPVLASTARAALGNGAPFIVRTLLRTAGATEVGATMFTSQLTNTILGLNHFNMPDVATELQRSLIRGAANVADAIGAGQGAALQPALAAMSQTGFLPGMPAGALDAPTGTAINALQAITSQLTAFNGLAETISGISQEVNNGLKTAVSDLHGAVTKEKKAFEDALKSGEKVVQDHALKGIGKTVGGALSKLDPFGRYGGKKKSGEKKVDHVTKTRWVEATKTQKVNKTKTETAHTLVRVQSTQVKDATRTSHKTVTDSVRSTQTVFKTVKSTETIKKTETVTKIKTKEKEVKVKVTQTKTKEKEVKHTTIVTATKTKKMKPTVAPAVLKVLSIDPSLTKFQSPDGKTLAVCKPNKDKVNCYGIQKNSPIQYNHFKDKKFEKCIRDGLKAKCFDKHFPDHSRVSFWSDKNKKIRGNACVAPHKNNQKIQCWGTPSGSHVKWHNLKQDKYEKCVQDASKC
jgi:hypothetical protein